MGRKKQPFIDRRSATTFRVVHRSQRDVGPDLEPSHDDDDDAVGGGKHVLLPYHDPKKSKAQAALHNDSSSPPKTTHMSKLKHSMASAGLLADSETYHYEQHYRPITGTGAFVSAGSGGGGNVVHSGQVALRDARSQPIPLQQDDICEVPRQLESIALHADCMDYDIQRALFEDYEEGEFEEILDDFCLTAAQEPQEQDDDDDDDEEFDYEAHIAGLIQKAKQQESGGQVVELDAHAWGQQDKAFFGNSKTLREIQEDEEWKEEDDDTFHDFDGEDFDEDDDDNATFQTCQTTHFVGVSVLDEDAERALCRKFEETLAEYDDDEMGDLEHHRDDIATQGRPLAGDAQVEAALDSFLQDQAEDRFVFGQRRVDARSQQPASYAALVGTRLVPEKLLTLDNVKNDEDDLPLAQVLAEATRSLQQDVDGAPPPEEILIDGKSYFSARPENPWDCESILSTYSNVDHRPVTIGPSSRRRRQRGGSKKTRRSEESNENASVHTDWPLRRNDDDEQEDDDVASKLTQASTVSRRRGESAAEKRARKAAVKQERQVARLEKKFLKEAFRDELEKRSSKVMADDVGGKSVLRFL